MQSSPEQVVSKPKTSLMVLGHGHYVMYPCTCTGDSKKTDPGKVSGWPRITNTDTGIQIL